MDNELRIKLYKYGFTGGDRIIMSKKLVPLMASVVKTEN
jgi:hypothetical protein